MSGGTRPYVFDANVVAAFYQEEVLEMSAPLTESALPVFASLGQEARGYIDDEDIIEHEWREVVDQEWLDPWLAQLLRDDSIRHQKPIKDAALRKRLKNAGFPVSSRDLTYVRTADALASKGNPAFLITEDPDFVDPAAKAQSASAREAALKSCSGPVAKILKKSEIVVASLCRCPEHLP